MSMASNIVDKHGIPSIDTLQRSAAQSRVSVVCDQSGKTTHTFKDGSTIYTLGKRVGIGATTLNTS
jgi:hypothetical protein